MWQWQVPELWRRFTITVGRTLAARCGLSPAQFRRRARVADTKVVEFQARGVIHVHAPIRVDGPHGPESPPFIDIDADQLGHAVLEAARHVRLTVPTGDRTGSRVALGAQLDVKPISHGAGRDTPTGPAHPQHVAAYLAKYLTKTTEDFGLPARVRHPWAARQAGASPHAQWIIDTAYTVAVNGGNDYERLRDRLATLDYRGHPFTKSRHYSTTFGALRRARAAWRRRPPGLVENAEIRGLLDDADEAEETPGLLVVKDWDYAGRSYLDLRAPQPQPSDQASEPALDLRCLPLACSPETTRGERHAQSSDHAQVAHHG